MRMPAPAGRRSHAFRGQERLHRAVGGLSNRGSRRLMWTFLVMEADETGFLKEGIHVCRVTEGEDASRVRAGHVHR